MTALKPYPEYKETGIEWLEDIPATWDMQPISSIANVRTSNVDKKSYAGELSVQLCNYTDVYYNDVIRSDMPFMTATASNAQVASFTLLPGDTVITKDSETPNDIGLSAFVAEPLPNVVCGYHLAVYRPRYKPYGAYIKRLFDSSYLRALLEVSAQGVTRVGLPKAALRGFMVPVPPEDEAVRIASFLDHETAEIDAFIADQQELITLLNERRAATITQAVTKGLDPSVAMKASGVQWLGTIPEAWETRKLKSLVSVPITDGPHETPEFQDDGVPFVSAEAVSSGRINFSKVRGYISLEDHRRFSRKYLPQRSDIYMIKSGATTGICAIVETDQEFNIWSPLAAIRCGTGVQPRFVLHALRSRNFQESVALFWTFGTQQNIGMRVLENLPIPLPSSGEQQEIADYLDCETAEIDAAITDAKQAIELSKERRAALISAAVTGKIDVRDHPAARGAA